ncbi:MAG TPA: hypothetical protein VGL82_05780 [Bryobacteraceae bacterium]|jgi:hypothetical protein
MASTTELLKQKLKALLEEFQQSRHDKTIAAESLDPEFPDDDDYTAMVCATLRPHPRSGAGGIALPEPDDRYPLT